MRLGGSLKVILSFTVLICAVVILQVAFLRLGESRKTDLRPIIARTTSHSGLVAYVVRPAGAAVSDRAFLIIVLPDGREPTYKDRECALLVGCVGPDGVGPPAVEWRYPLRLMVSYKTTRYLEAHTSCLVSGGDQSSPRIVDVQLVRVTDVGGIAQ
jgi:hypothetical protein